MKKSFLLAAAGSLLLTLTAQAQTADDIVNNYINARGGADKIKAIKTLVTENSLSVQGMDIPMKQTISAGKGYRMEMSVMGNDMVQVINENGGWAIRPTMMGGTGEAEDMPLEEMKGMSAQLDPGGPLFNYKEKNEKLTLVGKEKLSGKDVYHLRTTAGADTTNTTDYYLDATSGLLSKQVISRKVQGQDIKVETSYSDYKDVNGVKFAHTIETENPMSGPLTITTSKVTVNGPVDDKVFQKPGKK